ncbi:MAG: DUF2892 domain-containing protein [Chitinophagia bacterium]|nr:DUF2892 domain-containing protein [Chitinophagia bacterium]
MKQNMGTADRVIRLIIAVAVAALIATGKLSGTPAIIAGALGGIFALTSLVRFCPLYLPFGLSTCKK